MIEAHDAFDQVVKVSRGREHCQGGLDSGFELQSKISHARVKGITEDSAKGGELGGEGGC